MRPNPASGPALGRLDEERDLGVGDALHRVPVLGAVGRVEHEVVGARVDAVDQAVLAAAAGGLAVGVGRLGVAVGRRRSSPSVVVGSSGGRSLRRRRRRRPRPSVVGAGRWSSPRRRRRRRRRTPRATKCGGAGEGDGLAPVSVSSLVPPVLCWLYVIVRRVTGQVEDVGLGHVGGLGDLDRRGPCRRSTSASHDGLRDDLDDPGAQLAHAGDEAAGQQEDEDQQAEAEEHAGDGVAALAVLEPVEQRLGDLLERRAACPIWSSVHSATKYGTKT